MADHQLPRELMESCLAAAQEATFENFAEIMPFGGLLGGPKHRALLETVYRMGFESGWRIREQQIASGVKALPGCAKTAEGEAPCERYCGYSAASHQPVCATSYSPGPAGAEPSEPLSGETDAQRREVVAAWNDLPDALKAHPGLKRLYRALGGRATNDVDTSDGGQKK